MHASSGRLVASLFTLCIGCLSQDSLGPGVADESNDRSQTRRSWTKNPPPTLASTSPKTSECIGRVCGRSRVAGEGAMDPGIVSIPESRAYRWIRVPPFIEQGVEGTGPLYPGISDPDLLTAKRCRELLRAA